MILANGCNITKSEKFKGVWILSVPTVYIYLYNIYYCFLGVWTVWSMCHWQTQSTVSSLRVHKESIQCCFPPTTSSFSIVLPSLNVQLPWRSLIAAYGTNRHQSNEDVLIHSSTVSKQYKLVIKYFCPFCQDLQMCLFVGLVMLER